MRTLASIISDLQAEGNKLRLNYYISEGEGDGDSFEASEAEYDKLWKEFKDLLGLPVQLHEGVGQLDIAIAEMIGAALRIQELSRQVSLTEDEVRHYAGDDKAEEEFDKITDHMEAKFI